MQLPGDPAYDMARSPWNLQMRDYPAAVAYPAFPDEVAEVLRAAAAAGLQVAAQGTGHGAPPLEGRLGDAVLLRTSAMTELEIDADRRTVRAGAGVLWGDLADAAGRHGLASRHPSSPDVGVVGYTLGGGIGWYARKLGLQCNAVTAVELVLADGTLRARDRRPRAELFWALRGGAAPLGVVTALEFELFPLETVVAGALAWDWTAVERVLPAWVAWCADAPEEATTAFRLLDVPADRADPRRAARPADRDDRRRRAGRRRLRRRGARAAAGAALRSSTPSPGCRRRPWCGCTSTRRGRRRPTPAARWSPACPTPPSPASSGPSAPGPGTRLAAAELRQLGGALARPAPDGGALLALDGRFLALGLGLGGGDDDDWARQREDAARFLSAVEPWATGRQYLPMLDDRTDTRKVFPPGVHARLSAVRRAADPGNLFLAPHHGHDLSAT